MPIAAATAIFLHRLTSRTNENSAYRRRSQRQGKKHSRDGFKRPAAAARRASQHDRVRGYRSRCRVIRNGLEHQLFQIAELRRELGGIDDARSLFGLNLNIMRFDYDFSFAGYRAEAKTFRLDRSKTCRSRFTTGWTAVRFGSTSMPIPALHTADDVADRQQRFLRLLTAFAASSRTIASLDILAADERHKILRHGTKPRQRSSWLRSTKSPRCRSCSLAGPHKRLTPLRSYSEV